MLNAIARRNCRVLLLIIAATCVCHGMLAAETPEMFEALWFDTLECDTTANITLTLIYPETSPAAEMISLVVDIHATISYEATQVKLRVENTQNIVQHSAEIVSDLHLGRNEFIFNWNGASLAPGDYFLVVMADYADNVAPARCLLQFSKVSAAHWAQELALAEAALSRNAQRLEEAAAAGIHAPYMWLRLRIAEDARDTARRAMDAADWTTLNRNIDYIQNTMAALEAGLAFSGSTPELFEPYELPSLARIDLREGGLYADNKAVFLYGAALNNQQDDHENRIQRLARYGLNFCVASVPMGNGEHYIETALETTLRTASRYGVALAAQFDQNTVFGKVMDQWPELLEPGFVNMAHPHFHSAYLSYVSSLLSFLSGKPYVVGASIARNPRFKYDGDAVRLRFVERVTERYPDRIDLNRLWRSHLADYDEITIWGEYPEHNYQNRRAYQYEWQTFHRELITHFFAETKQELARLAPDVPVMLTLPETAFSPGETRFSPNREHMVAMMDINCSAAATYKGESLYSISYPMPHAYYTLIRSYTPNKPALNLEADIDVSGLRSADQRYALTRTAVWESAMGGVNGLALPASTTLFDYPEAIEAFASAAMDVNRLAPIIRAFQQDPAPIAILFSEASKIMDDGVPHLESARYAFEGGSFAGFAIRFLTEAQIEAGGLRNIKVLVLPETLAVSDETFEQIARYVEEEGMVARVGTPIPYNERGHSRGDVIRATSNTVLVRGMNLPTEYLHAMDAALVEGVLPQIPRPINAFGYPLEGVRARYVEFDNEYYLYIVNLRQRPVNCYLTGVTTSGRDLIQGRDVAFPRMLPPLEPILIRMDKRETEITVVGS